MSADNRITLERGDTGAAPATATPPAARPADLRALLLQRKLVSQQDIANAQAMQREVGGTLGHALQRLGAITEEMLLEVQSEILGLPVVEDTLLPVELIVQSAAPDRLSIPANWFAAHRAAAWLEDGALHVIAADPLETQLRETIEKAVIDLDPPIGRIAYALATNQALELAISVQTQTGQSEDDAYEIDDADRLREMAEEAPVIDFVNNVFAVALKENASDIHIEAFERAFLVRYRIDGVLQNRQSQNRSMFDAVSSRVKLLAGMDIAERRLPQDGRHTIRFAGNEIDLRVSSVPSTWGESLVIRLLRKKAELPTLQGLGVDGHAKATLEELLRQPNGVILVTGPTGSGKSTTLYRSLEQLNDGVRKIITIEDPVEYDVAGVTQIHVRPEIGYDFASGLRAILRQDPDIIMVGEIRDGETAKISAQAALTGHLVLSTLHTNSALAAVTRLLDIGLESFIITDAVRGLIAQRLVRRVCPKCSTETDCPEGETFLHQQAKAGARITDALAEPARWRAVHGCDACGGTGYQGRVAVFEVVKMDERLKEAILSNRPMAELFDIARTQGFTTLYEDAVLKARAGLTTLAEAHRVCGHESD